MHFSMAVSASRVHAHGQIVVRPGDVGSPVVVAFEKCGAVIVAGFDIDQERVTELRASEDRNNEAPPDGLGFTAAVSTPGPNDIVTADTCIVAVPTPAVAARRPNLTASTKTTEAAGRVLKQGDIIADDSTMYPGVTEERCLPIFKRISGFGSAPALGPGPERPVQLERHRESPLPRGRRCSPHFKRS